MIEERVERDRRETRIPLTRAPLLPGEWHEEPGALVASLAPQTCKNHRTWTNVRLKTTSKQPVRSVGAASMIVGSALDLAAVLALKPISTECDTRFIPSNQPGVGGYIGQVCETKKPDNTASAALFGTSLVFWGLGIVNLASPADVTTEQLSEVAHDDTLDEPCLSPSDRKDMVLLARSARGQVWPVRWRSGGEVMIPLPQTPPLPRGEELQLVVFRSRKESADLWRAGTVVSTFTLPPS